MIFLKLYCYWLIINNLIVYNNEKFMQIAWAQNATYALSFFSYLNLIHLITVFMLSYKNDHNYDNYYSLWKKNKILLASTVPFPVTSVLLSDFISLLISIVFFYIPVGLSIIVWKSKMKTFAYFHVSENGFWLF